MIRQKIRNCLFHQPNNLAISLVLTLKRHVLLVGKAFLVRKKMRILRISANKSDYLFDEKVLLVVLVIKQLICIMKGYSNLMIATCV
mmetsp:Transcript_38732/g.48939  ORF Transcript_38732/g.48939 Transcript_38732/m.48939 type:complete len:87 (+) Transcript_38732:2457-2717(+)